MRDDEWVYVEGILVTSTEKAILLFVHDQEEEFWIPKSLIHEDSYAEGEDKAFGLEMELVVRTWFAKKEGLA